jgi:maltose alpha-D-glucosyltransferase/alpha-amylase
MRNFLEWRKAEAMMLAEANIPLDQTDEYFGTGDRMNMIFNFMLNQHLFLALARGNADPIRKIMKKMPPIPEIAQWGTFLRNHDELDLGRLSKKHRQEVFAAFGPEPEMQLYDRGIRRRLAPMLAGDVRRLKMAHSLMFALPGTPVIWYGEELGMGEDLSLEERNSVRTPMQWSDKANANFSTAPIERLIRPVVSGGQFDYRTVNIAAQRDVPGSMMDHIQRLIRTRRSCPEVGWGEWRVLDAGAASVLALSYKWQGDTVITLHNLADLDVEARLPTRGMPAELTPLLSDDSDRSSRATEDAIAIGPYGFRWFRADGERR